MQHLPRDQKQDLILRQFCLGTCASHCRKSLEQRSAIDGHDIIFMAEGHLTSSSHLDDSIIGMFELWQWHSLDRHLEGTLIVHGFHFRLRGRHDWYQSFSRKGLVQEMSIFKEERMNWRSAMPQVSQACLYMYYGRTTTLAPLCGAEHYAGNYAPPSSAPYMATAEVSRGCVAQAAVELLVIGLLLLTWVWRI